jgi:hypothetical protein
VAAHLPSVIGRIVWRMDPKQDRQMRSRGAALSDNLVITAVKVTSGVSENLLVHRDDRCFGPPSQIQRSITKALFRASRRTATGKIVPASILRDAVLRTAPRDEVLGIELRRLRCGRAPFRLLG